MVKPEPPRNGQRVSGNYVTAHKSIRWMRWEADNGPRCTPIFQYGESYYHLPVDHGQEMFRTHYNPEDYADWYLR